MRRCRPPGLITVTVNADGTVSFALPRAEVGQGITTAVAMTIADEMGLPLDRVNITLADARPELLFNQFTGGSNTMHSIFDQVRVAAAVASGRLTQTAANMWAANVPVDLKVQNGQIVAPGGKAATIGDLAKRGAVSKSVAVPAQLKPASQFTLIGTPQGRIDAHDIVTGVKQFAMDLEVSGALPTMLCRAPTINASARRGPERGAGSGDARDHRRGDHPPHSVRCRRRRGPRRDLRAVHRGDRRASGAGAPARWTGSQTRTCWTTCAGPSCRSLPR